VEFKEQVADVLEASDEFWVAAEGIIIAEVAGA
jgi:hypothetical protein